MKRLPIFILLLNCVCLFGQQGLLITEVIALNVNVLPDDSSEFDDIIEIYNGGEKVLNLEGMYLANNPAGRKWKIPAGTSETWITPGEYKIIWCDKDEDQGALHAGFKLDYKGESIYLLDKDGTSIIDSVRYPPQYPDHSYGRLNLTKSWSFFVKPTPGQGNGDTEKINNICSKPVILNKGGFFDTGVMVKIDVPPNCEVYFTTNGNNPQPGEGSTKYEDEISIRSNTVIRVRAFRSGYLPSNIVAESFFINENISLPAVSISMDPDYLWDPVGGVYANPFKDFEKPVNLEYFDSDGKSVINLPLALKIFGYTSRNSSKQSFAVEAKEKFGSKRIQYAFFSDKPNVTSVDGLILRGDVTSGRGGGDKELAGERIKNELIYHINKAAGSHVDIQAYQPVILYLNGKYWGLYNLMEQKGRDFIKNNYGINEIDMLNRDDLELVSGDTIHYQQMLDCVFKKDITSDSVLQQVYSMIDVNSMLDYWIFEIYSATHDYIVNIRMWRPRSPEGKWRWIAYDEDSWGKYDEPSVDKLTTEYFPETEFFWNEMLENTSFRNTFINRFADLLSTVFKPEVIIKMIDDILLVIKDEKERDYERWRYLVNFVEPGSQITMMKDFAAKRPEILIDDILTSFQLPGTFEIFLKVQGKGTVQINTIKPETFPWKGIYFKEVPVNLTAVPGNGCSFKGWAGVDSGQNQPTITLLADKDLYSVTAIFE